jgi:hypothetical protein
VWLEYLGCFPVFHPAGQGEGRAASEPEHGISFIGKNIEINIKKLNDVFFVLIPGKAVIH